MFDWKKHRVCKVDGPARKRVLLAIAPSKRSGNRRDVITWDCGSHQRAFPVAHVIEDKPARFVFKDPKGGKFTLVPMTVDVYAREVRPYLNGPPLATDEDVVRHFTQPRY